MANAQIFTRAMLSMLTTNQTLLDNDYEVILVKSTYTFSENSNEVDNGLGDAADISTHECDCTGYAGGFGGAGRVDCTFTVQKKAGQPWVEVAFNEDITWAALGGEAGVATNNTIGGLIVAKKGVNDDTEAKPLFWFPTANTLTNGGPFDPTERAIGSGGNFVFFAGEPPAGWVG